MINSLVFAFLFFLPAGIANATPVLANKIPGLNKWNMPMDFGKTYRGQRVLGNNKSWRGFVTGSFLAGLTSMLLVWIIGSGESMIAAFLFGTLMGIGALTGDAVESFIKRQRRIPSGQSWFPFDQLDYIVGGLLVTYPITRLPFHSMIIIAVLFFGLHLLSVFIAYFLGLKDKPI